MRLVWLLVALAGAMLTLVLNTWALSDHVYWTHRWVDIPMHMLGGATIGALLAGILERPRIVIFFSSIFVAAVSWEVFEYFFNLAVEGSGRTYVFDTAYDLLNGAVGAALAYLVARKTIWR